MRDVSSTAPGTKRLAPGVREADLAVDAEGGDAQAILRGGRDLVLPLVGVGGFGDEAGALDVDVPDLGGLVEAGQRHHDDGFPSNDRWTISSWVTT